MTENFWAVFCILLVCVPAIVYGIWKIIKSCIQDDNNDAVLYKPIESTPIFSNTLATPTDITDMNILISMDTDKQTPIIFVDGIELSPISCDVTIKYDTKTNIPFSGEYIISIDGYLNGIIGGVHGKRISIKKTDTGWYIQNTPQFPRGV